MTRVGLTQRVTVVEEYGERRDCLDQQWTVLLETLGYTPVPLPNRVDDVEVYLDSLKLDAILLTSGNDLMSVDDPATSAPERDDFETAILEYAISAEIPVIGICRGLELINEYFGGTLTEVTDHVATMHQVTFNRTSDSSGNIAGVSLPEATAVNSYHDYGIDQTEVGDGLAVLGTASDGTVEYIVHESLPIWGIMWHPERESPSEELDRQILNHVLGGVK